MHWWTPLALTGIGLVRFPTVVAGLQVEPEHQVQLAPAVERDVKPPLVNWEDLPELEPRFQEGGVSSRSTDISTWDL